MILPISRFLTTECYSLNILKIENFGVLVDQHLLFRVNEVNKGREKKNKDIYNRRERSNNKKRSDCC